MRVRRTLVGLVVAGIVLGAVGAGVATAAPLTVQMPPPASAAGRAVPPVVVAFPLDPARQIVTAGAPRGRVRLTLAPGAWIVATSFSRRTGPRRVRARLVVVPRTGSAPVIRELQIPGSDGVAIGTITFQSAPDDPDLAPLSKSLDAAIIAEAAKLAGKAPCKPPIVPPATGDKGAIWQAIERAAAQAGRKGPAAVRGQARAAAARLSGAQPAATFGGKIVDSGSTYQGTFTIKDAGGNTFWEQSLEGTSVKDVLAKAFQEALLAKCEPSRIQVKAVFSVDTTGREARGTATIELTAIGRERRGPDGKPERGAFEYESVAQWTLRDGWTITKQPTSTQPNCALAPLPPNLFENPTGPPVSLALTTDGGKTFSGNLIASIAHAFRLTTPCDSQDAVGSGANVSWTVAGAGKTGRVQGALIPSGATQGTFTLDVTVTVLPSIP